MTRRKRRDGEGSLWYNEKRDRYEVRIWVDEKRRLVTAKTEAEAWAKADRLRVSAEAAPGLPAEVTVARFLNHWVSDVLPHADISRKTLESYGDISRLYICPTLGRVRLDQLSPNHVRKMLSTLRDQGLSPNTQRLARSVLRRALRTAEADGLVSRNVAQLVDGVKGTQTEGRTLTPDEARRVLDAARADDQYGALVVVMLALGLRRGEALGLSWSTVDLDGDPPTLTVRKSLKKTADGAVYLDQPKTSGSRRTVHLPAPVVDTLRAHRAEQNRHRLAFGAGWGGGWVADDLVFTSSIGTAMDPDRVNRAVKKLTHHALCRDGAQCQTWKDRQQKCPAVWTSHELRHSAASLLIAEGVPLKVISEMLGHSSIRVTADVYGHLLAPARTEAADAMTSALWGTP